MKKIKFILLAIIAFLRIGFVQSQDLQWIISNGYGKSSTTTAGGTINNNYGNLLSTSFTLSGVSNPNRDPATGNPKAKNNLFIIYKNGRFLNSREQVQYGDPVNQLNPYYPIDFFYDNQPASHHRFQINASSVAYMYLTNTYEEDDPPDLLKVKNGFVSPDCPTIHTPGYTVPKSAITATHEVMRSRDIVLIISNQILEDSFGISGPYSLQFNKIVKKIGGAAPLTGDFFEQSKVFQNGGVRQPVYPTSASFNYNSSNATIDLVTHDAQFTFVNITPVKDALDTYFPADRNGAATYEAIFEILVNGQPTGVQHTEDLVNAHDPNFIALTRVSPESASAVTWLRYRIQFENISEFPTTSGISASIKFDSRYDLKSIRVMDWKIGNYTMHPLGTPQNDQDNRLKIVCSDNTILPPGTSPVDYTFKLSSCNLQGYGSDANWGFIDFIVKAEGLNFDTPATRVEPIHCYVYFGNDATRVDEFRDLLKPRKKEKEKRGSATASLHRPFESSIGSNIESAHQCN